MGLIIVMLSDVLCVSRFDVIVMLVVLVLMIMMLCCVFMVGVFWWLFCVICDVSVFRL